MRSLGFDADAAQVRRLCEAPARDARRVPLNAQSLKERQQPAVLQSQGDVKAVDQQQRWLLLW